MISIAQHESADKLGMTTDEVARTKTRLKVGKMLLRIANNNSNIYLLLKTLLGNKGRFLALNSDTFCPWFDKVPLSENAEDDLEDLHDEKTVPGKKDNTQ